MTVKEYFILRSCAKIRPRSSPSIFSNLAIIMAKCLTSKNHNFLVILSKQSSKNSLQQ